MTAHPGMRSRPIPSNMRNSRALHVDPVFTRGSRGTLSVRVLGASNFRFGSIYPLQRPLLGSESWALRGSRDYGHSRTGTPGQ